MACGGAQERRDGLIADMVRLRERIGFDHLHVEALKHGARTADEISIFALGAMSVALDKLAAAVIALAGPCCEDCDDNEPEDPTIGLFQHMPKQGWSNPDHDVMADLREARDGILADRNGAPDEH